MNDKEAIPSSSPPRRQPWNKGKLIGAKPPLRVSHVWSIRTKLQLEGRTRDLALFNLAIDSKLRGCDVVAASNARAAGLKSSGARVPSALTSLTMNPEFSVHPTNASPSMTAQRTALTTAPPGA